VAKLIFVKALNSLRPADPAGEDALRKIGNGELVQIEIRKPRSLAHHRMFFALMTIVHDNVDHESYPTVEDLVAAVKLLTGHRRRIVLPGGQECFVPDSIAFHKLDQLGFSDFYDRVCDLVAKEFLPGVTSEELKAEVEAMIGVRNAA
jgi:hypothetical protein